MMPRATLERATQDPVWLRLYDQALAKLDDARCPVHLVHRAVPD